MSPETQRPSAEKDALGTFLQFADKVMALKAEPYAYAQSCCCGGSISVSREVPAAERRRLSVNFLGMHRGCVTPPEGSRDQT